MSRFRYGETGAGGRKGKGSTIDLSLWLSSNRGKSSVSTVGNEERLDTLFVTSFSNKLVNLLAAVDGT